MPADLQSAKRMSAFADPIDELSYRREQQVLLAEFARETLHAETLSEILDAATKLSAQALRAPFCKVLEYESRRDLLVMQAGVGWDPGDVGRATLSADCESPAGYAFHTGEPVLSNHLEAETHFRTPQLLRDYGIKRAINVLIAEGGKNNRPYGVLEVDSPDPGKFDEGDLFFLQSCAGIVGSVIKRHRIDDTLRNALERQEILTREMSHRVKNSLSVVASLLRLQRNHTSEPASKSALADAEGRVLTVAQIHDSLWQAVNVGEVQFDKFLSELCRSLAASSDAVDIDIRAVEVSIDADDAIALGLIVNELVTNALKYAYDPGESGQIEVSLTDRQAEGFVLAIKDQGKGLPPGFDLLAERKSFGLRIVGNLIRQLEGQLNVLPTERGTCFELTFRPEHAMERN